MILVIGVAVFSSIAPTLVGYSHQTYDPRLTSVVYVIVAIVLTVLIDRFGRALHTALAQARTRERELDALRLSLEQQITRAHGRAASHGGSAEREPDDDHPAWRAHSAGAAGGAGCAADWPVR